MDRASLARYLLSHEQLQQRAECAWLRTGVSSVDRALQGLPRGGITEICGPASSGKTSFLQAVLATATRAGECCAYVDATSSFDPASAVSAGATLRRLLWVRCASLNKALKAADLLLHGGGWGVVILDLADVPIGALKRLPMSHWYRYRSAVQNTSTVFMILSREPHARSSAAVSIEVPKATALWSGEHRHFQLLREASLQIHCRRRHRMEALPLRACMAV